MFGRGTRNMRPSFRSDFVRRADLESTMVALTKWMGTTPQRLRVQIQESEGDEMRRRRAIVVVNLIGIATMALTTLLQTGIVRRLPDPPRGNFDTKKVNSS